MPHREDMSSKDNMWNIFCAVGDIAFAYGFTSILFEIQASPLSLSLYTHTRKFLRGIWKKCA
ncbi:hypothetical protein Hanom_Chr10g00919371 [Helianthus anomalus]